MSSEESTSVAVSVPETTAASSVAVRVASSKVATGASLIASTEKELETLMDPPLTSSMV